MGKIKKILENELIGGTQSTDVYPVTSVKAVYNENNERLDNILNRIESGIIYDVSAHNGGVAFESLSALLSSSNLSTLIPISVRHAGMSIRFIQGSVQSSDNKYVQYRLMSATWSTTVADWQGVDDEPTAGSDNLVKSGGVANVVNTLNGTNQLLSEFEDTMLGVPINKNNLVTAILNGTSSNTEFANGIIARLKPNSLEVGKTYTLLVQFEPSSSISVRVRSRNQDTGWNTIFANISVTDGSLYYQTFSVSNVSQLGYEVLVLIGVYANSVYTNKEISVAVVEGEITSLNGLGLKDISKFLTDKQIEHLIERESIIHKQINSDTIIAGSTLNMMLDGSILGMASSNTYNISEYIDIVGAVSLSAKCTANQYAKAMAFYDKNCHFISSVPNSGGSRNTLHIIDTIPANAYYVRICYDNRFSTGSAYPYINIDIKPDDNKESERIVALNKLKRDKAIRFVYFTDSHYGLNDDESVSDGFTENERMQYLIDCIKAENAKSPIDFAISTGDTCLFDQGHTDEILANFKNLFIKELPFPLFTTVGNHDMAATEQQFLDCYSHGRQFSFETDGFYFICVDQLHHAGAADAYAEVVSGSVQWHNVYLDYDFIDAEVKKAKALDKEIVICFHMLYDMRVDDNNAVQDFYTYCHNNGIHLMLYGHQHVKECWNMYNNNNGMFNKDGVTNKNPYTDLWGICAGWFARRNAYPNIRQPWGFSIVEIKDGFVETTFYQVAHDYNAADGANIGNIPAAEVKQTVNTLLYYPIAKAGYQVWKFNNNVPK